MNYDDFKAAQFVDFEASLSSELDDDFNTLYSSLENLVCSNEKNTSRSFTVTSEYIPASVESSFELGEEYSTDFGDDPANPNAKKAAFRPESLVCSTEKKPSRTVALTSEYVSVESSFEPGQEENLIDFSDEPANSNAGKTPLDYLEKALFEFVQFQTDPQISSASLSKEVEKICSEGTRHDSPMNLPRDLTYRISSVATPLSRYGSPLSETQHVLSSSGEYESSLNRTGQDSLIGAMESLRIKSARKIKKNSENLEDFDGNSEIALIVRPYGISEASNFRDPNYEAEQSADQPETSLRPKSGEENLSSANILEKRTIGRTYFGDIIGEEDNSEIAKTVPLYEISEASDYHDKNCEDEQKALPTEISLRLKSDMENVSSSADIPKNQIIERTCMIGEEIAKVVPSYEIPQASHFRDKNCETELKALPTETSLQSKWDIENLLFLAHIAENQTTGRTYMIGEEDNFRIVATHISENRATGRTYITGDNSEIAKTVPSYGIPESSNIRDKNAEEKQSVPIIGDNSKIAKTVPSYGIPEASNIRDKNTEEKQSALPMETDVKNASSSANIAETQTTGKPFTCVKEAKSEIIETAPPCRILEASASIKVIEETAKDDCAFPKWVHSGAVSAEQKKKRKNPRVLTSQVRRRSLKYRRSSGQFVSMAEAMLKFQKGTPKRFRATVKKNQNRPAQPKIKSLQRVTCPVSPALRCKLRARPSKLPNQEEREMLEIEESRRNRFKATKSPGPQKSTAPREKSTASSSKDSNLLSVDELKTLPRRATSRRKTLVKSVVSTEDGPEIKDVEIFDFGVPIQRTKSPLTKPEPFRFEKREKKILEKREERESAMIEDERLKTIHQRSSAATSTVTSGCLEGAARKPIELTFRERNELLLAKKKLIADRAREKQAWVFHARLVPPVKQVLVRGTSTENLGSARVAPTLKPARGTSTENLGPAKVAPVLKQVPARGSSTENLGPAKVAPLLKQVPARGTSMENLGPANFAPVLKQVPARGTSTENLGPANFAPVLKQVPARGTSTENLGPAKVAPVLKQVPARGTSTENLGPVKVTPMVQAGPERITSIENLCPTKVAPMTKHLPGPTTSTENLCPTKVSPMTKQPSGPTTLTENLCPTNVAPMTKQLSGPTSTENLCPAKAAPMTKQLPGPTTPTENLGFAENKQKTRGLSPAGRSRGLSPAGRSRGLSPAERSRALSPADRSRGLSPAERSRELSSAGRSRGVSPVERSRGLSPAERSRELSSADRSRELSSAGRSRGLSPVERSRGLSPVERSRGLSPVERSRGLSSAEKSRGLSPSIADRENRDPNVSPISNQCPKLKASLSLYTEDRSKKRQEFDAMRRRKEEEAEEQRREYEAYRLAQEKKEERELRRTMESRARPMPVFKQPKIAKSLKPLTDPQSPAWSRKKTKK